MAYRRQRSEHYLKKLDKKKQLEKAIAKRPNFSDIERKEQRYDFTCDTCQQEIIQPYLKGLWYHIFNFSKDPFGCQKLVPRKYKPLEKWECDHDFRFTKDLTKALKCTKCGYALRFDLIDIESYLSSKFFCSKCKTDFKIMSSHIKKHKKKPFEFQVIR